MHINTREKYVKLRVRVDPAEGQDIMLNLRLKSRYLIRHLAKIWLPFLAGDDEMRYHKPILLLPPTEQCQCFNFILCVFVGYLEELNDHIQRAGYFFEGWLGECGEVHGSSWLRL